MSTPSVGLRARKKEATAQALQGRAIELFLERGYDETTVQDITDAAGVSQRTFFRYYATKDAVLLAEHARREAAMSELLVSRTGLPVRETLDVVLRDLVRDIVDRRDLVKVQAQVFLTVPALADRFSGHQDRLGVILSEFLAGELGVPADSDPRPRLLAVQVVRSWTVSILVWLTGGMTGDLEQMAADSLHLMRSDPLFVDPA
ncbi:MAG: TetR family transcriptional regulator [Iamia sp.]